MNGSPTPIMPADLMMLFITLVAEPRPAPLPDNAVSLELLEYLGGIDTAADLVHDEPVAPPANDNTKPTAPAPAPERRR